MIFLKTFCFFKYAVAKAEKDDHLRIHAGEHAVKSPVCLEKGWKNNHPLSGKRVIRATGCLYA